MRRFGVHRVRVVIGAAMLALAASGSGASDMPACNLPAGGQGDLSIIFDQINAMRIGKGMRPLAISVPLTIAAQVYACKLATPETSGLSEPSRAAAYVEIRRAGCNGQVLHDSVVRGMQGGWSVFQKMDGSSDLRRAFASAQVREIGLGIAAPTVAGNGPVWVITTASGC